MRIIFLSICYAFLAITSAYPQINPETPLRKTAVKNWQDMGFGMFVHWGAYTMFKGRYKGEEMNKDLWGEWIMRRANIAIPEYEETAKTFNPVNFNAENWVRLAKKAGIKYMVVTAKHHDGFAMYHSKASKYNIVDFTPFDRDPMKELSEECQKQNMKFGFYYSHRFDWHAPGGGDYKGVDTTTTFNDYWKNICLPQVEELTRNYGNIAVMWFDLGLDDKEKATNLRHLVLKNQPSCIIGSRIGSGQGDYLEQADNFVSEKPIAKPWETCMTSNSHWAWYPQDVYYKSADDIIRMLVSVRSMGGNLLLNIGPDNMGRIPLKETLLMTNVGDWMSKYSESIYGVAASPLPTFPWGRCTQKGDKLYLHIFDWPADGTLFVPGLLSKINKVYPLSNPADNSIVASQTSMGVELKIIPEQLKTSSIDRNVTVLVLECQSPLKTDKQRVLDHDFDNVFKAVTAELTAPLSVKRVRNKEFLLDPEVVMHNYVSRIMNFKEGAKASWSFNNERDDNFRVIIEYLLDAKTSSKPATLTLTCDGKDIPVVLEPNNSNSREIYAQVLIANVDISKGKNKTLSLTMKNTEGNKNLEIVNITLRPSHLE